MLIFFIVNLLSSQKVELFKGYIDTTYINKELKLIP
jgi:hypothetical protein